MESLTPLNAMGGCGFTERREAAELVTDSWSTLLIVIVVGVLFGPMALLYALRVKVTESPETQTSKKLQFIHSYCRSL